MSHPHRNQPIYFHCKSIYWVPYIVVGRGFLTPLFHEDPFSKFPPAPFLWLNVLWSRQIEFDILLSDIMELNFRALTSLGTLVPSAPSYIFYAASNQIYWRFDTDDMVLTSTFIWHHTYKHTQSTQEPVDWHTWS